MVVSISIVFLLFLLLLHVSLINVQLSHGSFREEDYVSRSQTNCIKGFAAVSIMLVHLSAVTETSLFSQIFVNCGSPLVALFFFYSGYGTMYQYQAKGEAYLKGFPGKKLKKLLVPWLILALIATVYYGLGAPSTAYFIPSAPVRNALEWLGEWVPNGWFVFVILLFDLVFYWLAHFFRQKTPALILCYSLFTAMYMLVMYWLNMGFWWYYRCHLFVFGLIWCAYGQKLVQRAKKHFWLWWGFLFAATLSLFARYILSGEAFVVTTVMLVLFVALVQLTCMKVKFENPILQWLGNISMEIYLIHGFALGILRSSAIYVEQDWLFGLLAVVLTLDISHLMHKCMSCAKISAQKSMI